MALYYGTWIILQLVPSVLHGERVYGGFTAIWAVNPISAVSRPKFTVLWGHLEDILLLNKFFSDCRYMP